jgi:hypothetical protein
LERDAQRQRHLSRYKFGKAAAAGEQTLSSKLDNTVPDSESLAGLDKGITELRARIAEAQAAAKEAAAV